MYKIINIIAIFCFAFFLSGSHNLNFHTVKKMPIQVSPEACESDDGPGSRFRYELDMLKDPATGMIPRGIRRQELEFAKNLPKSSHYAKDVDWENRGPWNVGGRTRALAIDVMNEDRMIAGGVSGGVWLTENAGQTWTRITPYDHLLSITCIAQDTRAGKTGTWYYGTGEYSGNSASADFSAWYVGNGIYKSTDNGLTWQSLPSTASNAPEVLSYPWDFTWNMVTDASTDTADIIYVAAFGSIMRSGDGGASWTKKLGNQDCIYTDVAISSTGVVYATLSSESSDKGIWRSADGITWTKINPSGLLPSSWNRIVIGITPSQQDVVYFVAETPGSGLLTHNYEGDALWHSLWRYTYLGGDGTGANGQWEDLSQNLPSSGTSFDNFNSQGSYDLVIKVKPDNPNMVFIGATNVYRSDDAFSTPDHTVQIGGYAVGSIIHNWHVYLNHHPDQHVFCFLPSNPNVLISGNDGGVFRTDNCLDSVAVWNRLDHGYQTTQHYTVNCDMTSTNNIVVTGLQDNGNYFTNSTDPQQPWNMSLNGDGSYSAIADSGQIYYLSIQNGKIFKMTLDTNGLATGFGRIDPIGGTDYNFINPFVVDPNNNNVMYVAGGHTLWRNKTLSQLPLVSNYDSISTGWTSFSFHIPGFITCMAISEIPGNVLYLGTNTKHVYRFDAPNLGDPVPHDFVNPQFPAARANCIAVDPRDASKVIVVFSNYEVYSLFYSNNGGTNWIKGAGNLEPNDQGIGPGPSLRWVSIMPFGNETLYLLGTSIGLFATDHLDSTATQWVQTGAESIGNTVVDMVINRKQDDLVLVATHGRGLFSTHINSISDVIPAGITEYSKTAIYPKVFPNPAVNKTSLSFTLPYSAYVNADLYDNSGRKIIPVFAGYLSDGNNRININTAGLNTGLYYCRITAGKIDQTVKIMVLR
ncbi:MAG: T9SS type A sorting domain-containing protein [Bacteroidia bacterium]|nr:T9SS type A sorting domain-containing protein [Bacteroidia bacterium]